jgi:BMFP domain-containing protein YqiC
MDSETAQAFERLSREFRDGLQGLRTELQTGFQDGLQEVRTDLQTGFQDGLQGLRTELQTGFREGFQEVRTELRNEIQEVRRHADVVAESLRGEIRLVAEGVVGLDEKFTLEFRNVREEMREQIGEVKTLLRLSYADLERRIKPS